MRSKTERQSTEAETAAAALEAIQSMAVAPTLTVRDGQPMLFFHGTRSPADFETFSCRGPLPNDDGIIESDDSGPDPTAYLGAHFAEEREVAASFAHRTCSWMRGRPIADADGDLDPRIIAVALAVRNPAMFETEDDLRSFIWREGSISDDAFLFQAMELKHRVVEGTPEADAWVERYETDAALRHEINEHVFLHRRTDPDEDPGLMLAEAAHFADAAREALIKLGHDGVCYRNGVEGGVSWIAFEPDQIIRAYSVRTPRGGGETISLDTDRNGIGPAVTQLYRAQGRDVKPGSFPSWMEDNEDFRNSKAAEGRWFTDSKEEAEWYDAHEHLGDGEIVEVTLLARVAESFRVSNLPVRNGGKSAAENPAAFSLRPHTEFFLPATVAKSATPLFDPNPRPVLPTPVISRDLNLVQ